MQSEEVNTQADLSDSFQLRPTIIFDL